MWRGLVIAPENRCSPYDPNNYPYSQSVEERIVADMGGIIYGHTPVHTIPVRVKPTLSILWRGQRLTIVDYARLTPRHEDGFLETS